MTSPSARPGSALRRRQRSTRLVLAGALLGLAAIAVVAAVISGSWIVAVLAAVVATVLGAAATRITYTEVADTRRSWARDRAEQAQAYAALTEVRTSEQALYVADTSGRLARHEATIGRLETRLADAAAELAASRAELASEQDKALATKAATDADLARMRTRLEDAEERAAMAIVQVAELEQELDVVQAELVAWQTTGAGPRRKHA